MQIYHNNHCCVPINYIFILTIILFCVSETFCFTGCVNGSLPNRGCITCDNTSLSLAFNNSENLYTCIDSNLNCISWSDPNICLECSLSYVLNGTQCVNLSGCQVFQNNTCVKCLSSYILSNGSCTFDQLNGYCLVFNGTICLSCIQQWRDPANNCTVFTNLCANYDLILDLCIQCPSNTSLLHQSGKYCIQNVVNCLQYDYLGCIICQENYVFDGISCNIANLVGVLAQFVENNSIITTCIRKNYFYNTTVRQCMLITSNITFCISQINGTCSACRPGYYLQSNTCNICTIQNCISCISAITCTSCSLYFVQSPDFSGCLACQIYSCKTCRSTNSRISCTSCNNNGNLFDGLCYYCTNGTGFNSVTKQCEICPANCINCEFKYNDIALNIFTINCKQCSSQYISTGVQCETINSVLANITLRTSSQLVSALSKISPLSDQLIYNNQTLLLINCQDTNGFICLCPNISFNSLCQPYTIVLNQSSVNINSFLTTFSLQNLIMNMNLIRIYAEFTNYNWIFTSTSIGPTILSQKQFASLLQAYYFRSLKNVTVESYLTQIFLLTRNNMLNVFSTTANTIIFGNGYYYKFCPTAQLCNVTIGQFVSFDVNATGWVFIYIRFDRIPLKNITGSIYVLTSQNVTSLGIIRIRKLGYITDQTSLKLYINGLLQQNSTIKLSAGYLIFNILTSQTNIYNKYQLTNEPIAGTDPYIAQRIENVFYRESFVYILVFLLLYLVLIPLCSIYDFNDQTESIHRKIVTSEDFSDPDKKNSSEQQSVVIRVNYKQFFPIYNISNTPRPRRLVKLCLFLLNIQHSITILTLIYFNLQPNQSVIAVVLFIPGYICTIIMGYICGFITVNIPGDYRFKFLLNILVIGYWIIWVVLMERFLSQQYKPFIYVFTILFFIIDMLFDAFQTLLLYFVIKQQEKQVAMFRILAKWLSIRGYYEFDKLAKEIIQ